MLIILETIFIIFIIWAMFSLVNNRRNPKMVKEGNENISINPKEKN